MIGKCTLETNFMVTKQKRYHTLASYDGSEIIFDVAQLSQSMFQHFF